jgi:hypothetical protein
MNEDSTLSVVVFPAPVPPGDEDVEPPTDAGLKEVGHRPGHGAEADEVVDVVGVCRELADGQQRPVDRQWGDHGVDPLPSGRRASTIGLDSSTRRPIPPTILSIVRRRCASFVNCPSTGSMRPLRSM